MKTVYLLFALTLLLSTVILADIRLPDNKTPKPAPSKSIDTTLSVRINKDTKEAKLVIPRSQLKELRAELEQLENDSDNVATTSSFSKTQTVVSGTFLSLAFILGGVWLVRSRKIDTKTGKALAIGAVLFMSGAVATITLANAGPPSSTRSITNKFFSKEVNDWKQGYGKIKLEVSDQVKEPTLYVPDIPENKKNSDEE